MICLIYQILFPIYKYSFYETIFVTLPEWKENLNNDYNLPYLSGQNIKDKDISTLVVCWKAFNNEVNTKKTLVHGKIVK